MNIQTLSESENWMRNLFNTSTVDRGGVVHCAAQDVEGNVGRTAFLSEVRRLGFTLVENGAQYVVFCNRDPVRLLVNRVPPSLSEQAMPVFRRSIGVCQTVG